ncbi:hypothetical protein ABKV19_026806 [Rosa sericea]
MSSRPNEAVSIDLRNLGSDLEEESDKEDENRPTLVEILKERDKATHWWTTFFLMLCAFGVFIDPLFCYIYVIDRDRMRISQDCHLSWAYIGLRMGIDVFYVIDIIIYLRGICKKNKGEKFGACCWEPRTYQKSTVISLKQVIKRRCSLLPRILVALPIPEGLVALAYYKHFDVVYAIFVITPFQYTLRVFLIYGSKRWSLVKKTTTGRWLKPLLDFLPFILASHIFGALWYRLAVQRQIDCWKPHCPELRGHNCTKINDFYCNGVKDMNTNRLQELCPTNSENKTNFDFGIYLYALQSDSIGSFNLPRRISQSFWWALRNLRFARIVRD